MLDYKSNASGLVGSNPTTPTSVEDYREIFHPRTMNGYDVFHTYSTSVNCVAAITKEVANL